VNIQLRLRLNLHSLSFRSLEKPWLTVFSQLT
jgi:hypothetical protein